ncbi:MAG: response regulator [Pseudomonadota bacterium]
MSESFATRPHILVVDDDDRIRSLLARYLLDQQMVVMTAANAAAARDILAAFDFDLLILDIMMPGETGLSLLGDLRRTRTIPVIMLTALGETTDRITGLENGADDYLAKPFDPKELLLRIHAILKRQNQSVATTATASGDTRRCIGPWMFDMRRGELLDAVSGACVKLTQVEANLLRVLSAQPGKILNREDLAQLCQLEGQERAIDVQVTRLRRKLEVDPGHPRYLQTIRGKGYILYNDLARASPL